MQTFDPGTVCVVPFPYVERPVRKRRPCVVVGAPAASLELYWMTMITSRANDPWPGDVVVSDLDAAGLPHPSVVRTAKIATVEAAALAPIGTLVPADWSDVLAAVSANLPAAQIQ